MPNRRAKSSTSKRKRTSDTCMLDRSSSSLSSRGVVCPTTQTRLPRWAARSRATRTSRFAGVRGNGGPVLGRNSRDDQGGGARRNSDRGAQVESLGGFEQAAQGGAEQNERCRRGEDEQRRTRLRCELPSRAERAAERLRQGGDDECADDAQRELRKQ